MKVIDFDKKGNVIRLYIGEDACKDYGGDDWDDRPYESNAGTVYEEYVKGMADFAFPYDYLVLEPCNGEYNSPWCKDDFKKRKTPCLIIVDRNAFDDDYYWYDSSYKEWVGYDKALKVYYEDNIDELAQKIVDFGGVKL